MLDLRNEICLTGASVALWEGSGLPASLPAPCTAAKCFTAHVLLLLLVSSTGLSGRGGGIDHTSAKSLFDTVADPANDPGMEKEERHLLHWFPTSVCHSTMPTHHTRLHCSMEAMESGQTQFCLPLREASCLVAALLLLLQHHTWGICPLPQNDRVATALITIPHCLSLFPSL